MTTPSPARRSFAAYGLPLSQRRHGTAVLLSLLAHTTIAVAVLWRGAALFHGGGAAGPRGGGGGERGGRPAVSWFALPAPSGPRAQDVPAVPAAPAVSVPVLALPPPAVDIDIPLLSPPPAALPVAAVAGVGEGTVAGQGSGTGGGQGTGAGTGSGADRGPGSGGAAGYIFPASPRWTIFPPPGAPRETRGRRHEVRFWVTADGRVTRVEVTPPIKDAAYRREFTERMMGYLFNPATTRDGRRVEFVASVIVIP